MKNYLRDKLSRTASACLGVALTRSWILPALIAALNSLPAGRVTAQTFTTLHRFTGAPDTQFPSSLLKATNGFFYGLTQEGGTANGGTVFRMDSTGAVTVLHIFSYGANITSLIQASNGFFYGTAAQAGASGFGTIFRMDSVGAVTVLHSFSGTTDGGYPFSALLEASDGFFYGTAPSGGANRFGTVYRMDSSSAVTVLHSFSEADGTNPNASLIQASDGFFYGTAFLGGASGVGTIFRMNTTGTVTVLHHSLGSPGDGALPITSI